MMYADLGTYLGGFSSESGVQIFHLNKLIIIIIIGMLGRSMHTVENQYIITNPSLQCSGCATSVNAHGPQSSLQDSPVPPWQPAGVGGNGSIGVMWADCGGEGQSIDCGGEWRCEGQSTYWRAHRGRQGIKNLDRRVTVGLGQSHRPA